MQDKVDKLYDAMNAIFKAEELLKLAGCNGPTIALEHERKKIEAWINELEEQ